MDFNKIWNNIMIGLQVHGLNPAQIEQLRQQAMVNVRSTVDKGYYGVMDSIVKNGRDASQQLGLDDEVWDGLVNMVMSDASPEDIKKQEEAFVKIRDSNGSADK